MIRGPLFCLFHPRQAWQLIDALIESCASCDLDIELLTEELHEHRAVTAGTAGITMPSAREPTRTMLRSRLALRSNTRYG
jgi:hypothetical protein